MRRDALISYCGNYRYWLTRDWSSKNTNVKVVCFVMLNPSKADAEQDDPTIRRCINYAKDWGFSVLLVVNIHAYRATKPADLRKALNPEGPDNLFWLKHFTKYSDLVVCAWGNHGAYNNQSRKVLNHFKNWGLKPKCFGLSNCGEPLHPLYQKRTAELIDMRCE